jgi:restriction system protein
MDVLLSRFSVKSYALSVLVALVIAAVIVIILIGIRNYKHSQALLFQNSELAQADAMTGPQFERYFADLLRLRGHHGVRVVGGAGDGGVDILATAPDGRAVAYQCKRQVANVSVQVVRQLIGSVTVEHYGKAPCLVTTAYLTKPAADLARQSGVQVVNRPMLGKLMADARLQLSGAGNASLSRPQGASPIRLGALVPTGRVLVAIGKAFLVTIALLLQVLISLSSAPPRSRRRRSPARRRSSARGSSWWA